jgi:hypothetical protein
LALELRKLGLKQPTIAVNIIAVRAQTGKFLVEHHRSLNVRYEFALVEMRIGRQKYETR